MNSLSRDLGRIIRERRIKLGMTQAQIAALTGKKPSQIVRFERGLVDPRLSTVVEVSNSLGMEIVAVPIRLLPAVQHLLRQQDSPSKVRSRLVGNDPENLEAPEEAETAHDEF
jgi:transcriptional regulator with XRE-family HTH domain